MKDNNIIAFEKRPKSSYLSLDMNDPELAADIARADEMVSYDINAMSIEELREHARRLDTIAQRYETEKLSGAFGSLEKTCAACHADVKAKP